MSIGVYCDRLAYNRSEKYGLNNGLLFAELIKRGCDKRQAVSFSTKSHCLFDISKKRAGPKDGPLLSVSRKLDPPIQEIFKGCYVGKPIISDEKTGLKLAAVKNENKWIEGFLKFSEQKVEAKKENFKSQLDCVYRSHRELHQKYKISGISRRELLVLMKEVRSKKNHNDINNHSNNKQDFTSQKVATEVVGLKTENESASKKDYEGPKIAGNILSPSVRDKRLKAALLSPRISNIGNSSPLNIQKINNFNTDEECSSKQDSGQLLGSKIEISASQKNENLSKQESENRMEDTRGLKMFRSAGSLRMNFDSQKEIPRSNASPGFNVGVSATAKIKMLMIESANLKSLFDSSVKQDSKIHGALPELIRDSQIAAEFNNSQYIFNSKTRDGRGPSLLERLKAQMLPIV